MALEHDTIHVGVVDEMDDFEYEAELERQIWRLCGWDGNDVHYDDMSPISLTGLRITTFWDDKLQNVYDNMRRELIDGPDPDLFTRRLVSYYISPDSFDSIAALAFLLQVNYHDEPFDKLVEPGESRDDTLTRLDNERKLVDEEWSDSEPDSEGYLF